MRALLTIPSRKAVSVIGLAASFLGALAGCSPACPDGARAMPAVDRARLLRLSGRVAPYVGPSAAAASARSRRRGGPAAGTIVGTSDGAQVPVVRRLRVLVEVPELDAPRLRLRAPARIRLPAAPAGGGAEWLGEVEEIHRRVVRRGSSVPERCSAMNPGVVWVAVRLFGDHSTLRLDQRVDVELDG